MFANQPCALRNVGLQLRGVEWGDRNIEIGAEITPEDGVH